MKLGGLAYEGLSNAGQCGQQLLVILNDNGMSITRNVGGVAQLLARQRLKPKYLRFKQNYRRVMHAFWLGRQIYKVTHELKRALKQSLLPCSMFEDMGFTYLGPVDGHDVAQLTETPFVDKQPVKYKQVEGGITLQLGEVPTETDKVIELQLD